MASPSNSSQNGGILGVSNKTSFGRCTVTCVTATGTVTTQPGTGVVQVINIAGGASGSGPSGGGGGAGGFVDEQINVCGNSPYTATIGAGGATRPASTIGNSGINSTFGITCGTVLSTSTGGGGGGFEPNVAGAPGGSGGGSSGS